MHQKPTPLPDGVRCPGCGYDMGGLVAGTCPECGRFLETGEVYRARELPAYVARCRMRLAWWIALVIVMTAVMLVLVLRTMWAEWAAWIMAMYLLSLGGFVCVSNGLWLGKAGSRAFYRAYWLDNLWMLLTPLMAVQIAAATAHLGRLVMGAGTAQTASCSISALWIVCLVMMPNVFLWRLHVLQLRFDIDDTFPAMAYVAGALLTFFVNVLGVTVMPWG